MRIVTDESRDVFDVRKLFWVDLGIKQGIELGDEPFVPTHGPDETRSVLRYVPCVLPRITLGVIAVVTRSARVEWVSELAIAFARANKSRLRIEYVAPVPGAL